MNKTLKIALFSLVILCSGCKEEQATPPKTEVVRGDKKPNIVLILADDQGWGDLRSSGNLDLETPNIDGIAKYGVSFDNFYVQPVCSPTRAELLTGRYFPRTGVYSTSAGGERINYDETTLAEILKKAGYTTAAYGKWHSGTQPPYHPNSKGFDDYYGFASGHWGNYFSPMLEHNGEVVEGNGFLVDDLTDHGLSFIEKNQESPFFLYLPFNTPHSPMQVPDEYWERFTDKELRMRSHRASEGAAEGAGISGGGGNDETIKLTKAALAMVENIDFNVGRVMAKLRKLYLEDDTIVIYLTDNGPNGYRWNGSMRGIKGHTDEGGVRSPLYMQWKDSLPEGKKIVQTATALDLLPTLTKLAGVAAVTENAIDGEDLTPLLYNENPDWEDRIIYNYWNGKTSLRTQNYRLDAENRLYDMQNDREQRFDVSAKHPQVKDSLVNAKDQWLSEVSPLSADTDKRPLTLGHPSYLYTWLPARDGIPHGNIERSNRYPNDSFFENWTSAKDSITWDVEILADGHFDVELYYTVSEENLGSIVELSLGKSKIAKKITEKNNPPLKGMDRDRVPRIESYVKDFKPMDLGTMVLKKGKGILTLKSLEVAGKEVADVRLLVFRKVE
ncbi:arylsulfatase [Pricia sp. S334]|uniref:Arylsulfatase n=1 Tax=Pricia mediterranea TaxID=3076079 RepID=A0ABU3L9N1_9FLAO|nr:arylsulfatase [Pricia sp. S334]MDT7830419.1 arylsulfatase [Pricia sp. S334]